MDGLKFLAAVIVLLAATLAPSISEARAHHRHHRYYHTYRLPYPISYLHNYGPGLTPGTFDYYDGPNNRCYQSSAAYVGQDGRRHPCF